MKYQISSRQAFSTYFIIVSLTIGLPNILINVLKQDFWQAVILAMIIEVALGWCLFKMGLKYPNQTIFQYSEKILGKIMGKVLVGVFCVFFIGVTMLLIMMFIDFFGSIIMPETPKYVFAFLVLLVSTYAVCSGIEVIMRLSELFAVFIIGSYLFISIFNIRLMDLDNLKPIFQHSIGEVAHGTVLASAWFGICIIMGVIMAYHNNPQKMFKIKVAGVGLGILSLTIIIFMVIMAIGPEVSSEQKYAVFLLARMAKIGVFIERLEAFQVASWTAGIFFIISLFHFLGVEGLNFLFPKKSKLFLGVGVAILIFVLTIYVFPSSNDKSFFAREIFAYYGLAIEVGGVLLLYFVFLIKEKFKRSRKRA